MTDKIKYVGCDDADLKLFESQYKLTAGMCYNSYVIQDEKVAVMDTTDWRTVGKWKENLAVALNGRKPDYLVVHHLEPDHSSGIAEVLNAYPDIRLVCTAKASAMLPNFFPECDFSGKVIAVKDGDSLCLGSHILHFITAPMVHWPEVMVSYESSEKLLFSADAFGKFGVFNADPGDWTSEARRYYCNICGKYGVSVTALLKKAAVLDIETVLPLHGPILEGDGLSEALRLYKVWSSYEAETDGVMLAYASIHGCTGAAVAKLAEILKGKGCKDVTLVDLCREDMAKAVGYAFKYGKIILAASSYDGGLFPPMADFLHHLQSKAWQKREVAIVENGSWAPSAGRVMKQMLDEMKEISIKGDVLTLRGAMKEGDIVQMEALADAILA